MGFGIPKKEILLSFSEMIQTYDRIKSLTSFQYTPLEYFSEPHIVKSDQLGQNHVLKNYGLIKIDVYFSRSLKALSYITEASK